MRKFAGPVVAALALAAADQATKLWVASRLGLFEARAVLPDYLHIVHVRNTGVAFGFLSGLDPGWVNPLLIAATAFAALAVLAYLYYIPAGGPAPYGLGLVLGGAVGNLVDRARLGYVVDFVDLHWRRFHWPAFNAADIGITAGIFLLILDTVFRSREDAGAPGSR